MVLQCDIYLFSARNSLSSYLTEITVVFYRNNGSILTVVLSSMLTCNLTEILKTKFQASYHLHCLKMLPRLGGTGGVNF